MVLTKLGVIGIGDIAKKAYLPVYAGLGEVDLHFFTRNNQTLSFLQNNYRFQHIHQNLQSLINSGIEGALVHSSTDSHFEIVEELLKNNIHVYVDKPITNKFESTRRLLELADKKNLILTAGFNRRFAPSYQKMKELSNPNMIVLQKNRSSLPDHIRTFVYDDFIHVIDTLLFLFPNPIEKIIVNGRKKEELLYDVTVQFISKNCTAIGIMNRDSGTTEEKLEVMSNTEKRIVHNVSEMIIYKDMIESKFRQNDWEPTLHKRGFEQIVSNYIDTIHSKKDQLITKKELLLTHEICELVVRELEKL